MTVEGLCYGLTVTINEFKIPDEIYPEFFLAVNKFGI